MNWLPISEMIRDAADALEREMSALEPGSHRWAECRLAWHKLIDANALLSSQDPSVDALMWGYQEAEKITEQKS